MTVPETNVTETISLNAVEDLCLTLMALAYALSNHCNTNPDIWQMELIDTRADRLRALLADPPRAEIQEETSDVEGL